MEPQENYQPQYSFEMDHRDIRLGFNELPALPKKPLFCSICLLVVGVGLIITGFIEEVIDVDPTRGIAFWVLGSLTFIPGAYFSYQFFRAYRATSARQRTEILSKIPVMD